jgi:endonuclease/exonuclease/phosphatase family metal-dependent hydrolase
LSRHFKDLSCSIRHRELCSGPTYNAFTLAVDDDKIIDYFLGSPELISMQYQVVQTPFDCSFPSDHFPIVLSFISL